MVGFERRHDIQANDIQANDTRQKSATEFHSWKLFCWGSFRWIVQLSVVMPRVLAPIRNINLLFFLFIVFKGLQ